MWAQELEVEVPHSRLVVVQIWLCLLAAVALLLTSAVGPQAPPLQQQPWWQCGPCSLPR